MESKSRAKAVGLFVLAMLAMLVVTVLWFAQDRTPRDVYDILTDRSADGVVPQAAVELHGLNVGKVESVSFVENKPGYVRIRLLINKSAPINLSTYATITSRGVTGVPFVALSDDDKMPMESRMTSLESVTPAGEVPVIPLRLSALASFTDGITQFSERADDLLKKLDSILTQENQDRLMGAIDNIGNAAGEIAQLSNTVNKELLGEVTLVTQQATKSLESLDVLINNVNGLVSDARKEDGAVQRISDGVEALTQATNRLQYATLPQVELAAENFSTTLRSADGLMEKLSEQPNMLILGEGRIKPGPGEEGYQSPYAKQ